MYELGLRLERYYCLERPVIVLLRDFSLREGGRGGWRDANVLHDDDVLVEGDRRRDPDSCPRGQLKIFEFLPGPEVDRVPRTRGEPPEPPVPCDISQPLAEVGRGDEVDLDCDRPACSVDSVVYPRLFAGAHYAVQVVQVLPGDQFLYGYQRGPVEHFLHDLALVGVLSQVPVFPFGL